MGRCRGEGAACGRGCRLSAELGGLEKAAGRGGGGGVGAVHRGSGGRSRQRRGVGANGQKQQATRDARKPQAAQCGRRCAGDGAKAEAVTWAGGGASFVLDPREAEVCRGIVTRSAGGLTYVLYGSAI